MKKFLLLSTILLTLAIHSNANFIISQVYEGSSSDKYIEITNTGPGAVNFTVTPYFINCITKGSAFDPFVVASGGVWSTFALTGTLAAGGVLLYRNQFATQPGYATSAPPSTTTLFNGTYDVVFLSTNNSDRPMAWTTRTDVVYPVVSNSTTGTDYADRSLVRVNSTPSITFNVSDWSTVSLLDVADAISGTENYLGSSVLPITLKTLTATPRNNKTTQIDFTTATETNNSHFNIERSADGVKYESIGRVQGNGTTAQEHNYSFTDEAPLAGVNYYRLHQVDFDGQSSYSKVVSVRFGKSGQVYNVYPNPASDVLKVETTEATEGVLNIEIYNQAGALVKQLQYDAETAINEVPVADLPAGSYIVKLMSGSEVTVEKFTKQ